MSRDASIPSNVTSQWNECDVTLEWVWRHIGMSVMPPFLVVVGAAFYHWFYLWLLISLTYLNRGINRISHSCPLGMQNIQLVFLEPLDTRQASCLRVLERLIGYSASPRGTRGRSSIYFISMLIDIGSLYEYMTYNSYHFVLIIQVQFFDHL